MMFRHHLKSLVIFALVHFSNALRIAVAPTEENLPQNGRIAILVRGQAFRSKHLAKGCDLNWQNVQHEATDSFIRNIVEPLEHSGNKVDLFILNGDTSCEAFQSLIPKYGDRIVSVMEVETQNQGDNMRKTLNQFKDKVGSPDQIAKQYGVVMIVRHDTIWKMNVDSWPTVDFNKFNFFSLCPKDVKGFSGLCVNDIFYMMPAAWFNAFDAVVGTRGCFKNGASSRFTEEQSSGHGCWPGIADKINEEQMTFITDWVPGTGITSIREPNPIADMTFVENQKI